MLIPPPQTGCSIVGRHFLSTPVGRRFCVAPNTDLAALPVHRLVEGRLTKPNLRGLGALPFTKPGLDLGGSHVLQVQDNHFEFKITSCSLITVKSNSTDNLLRLRFEWLH
jgi:hypothetical protein